MYTDYQLPACSIFAPWSNAAEREIKELKKGSTRRIIRFCTPKRLLHDCLELEPYIRSNTTHGINKLYEEVPKMIMSSETSALASFVSLNGLNR